MKKLVVVTLVLMGLLLVSVGTVLAITDGELDGEGHPFVGLALFYDENDEYMWRCSGTLLSDTVFLTAGHCTYSTTKARILFDADLTELEYPYPDCGPYTCYEGSTDVHPDYDDYLFWLHDVGVVILEEPGVPDVDTFGELPEVDSLDVLKTRRGKQETWFTAVGYGLQRINPVFVEAERIRMVATPRLIQINTPGFTGDYSLLLSNNHSTGGTCFGDSGGPNFLTDTNVVAGVTSFGMNGNCAGTGGVFRMDRQNVLDFVSQFLE